MDHFHKHNICYKFVLLPTAFQLREHEKEGHNKKADESTANLRWRLPALDLTAPLSPGRAYSARAYSQPRSFSREHCLCGGFSRGESTSKAAHHCHEASKPYTFKKKTLRS